MILSQLCNKKLQQKEIEQVVFEDVYDLIIAGLGTAGSIAAIAAARRSINVLGIEKLNCMGGSATAGGVFGYYWGVDGGLFNEIDRKANMLQKELMTAGGDWHVDAKKVVMEEEAVNAGAAIAYDTTIIGVYLEGNSAVGVKCVTSAGIKNYQCKFLMDGSGDGEIAAMAGCSYQCGRESDGACQPYSHVRQFIVNKEHTYYANFDAGYLDPCDGEDVSRAIIHGGSLHMMERYSESDKTTYLAPIIGGREGRRIVGEETVSFQEFLTNSMTDQPAFYELSNIDTHSRDWAFEDDVMLAWLTVANLWGQNMLIPVPVGALISKDIANLMPIGRCLSVDHNFAQCIRMQKAMQKSGEAAAITVSMALKQNLKLKDVPYNLLKDEFSRSGLLSDDGQVPFKLITEGIELENALASNDPGMGIWSAFQQYDNFKEQLLTWLNSANPNLVRHSALALGIAKERDALPALRNIVKERDGFVPETKRMNNARRICSAISLLGRLHDDEFVNELLALVSENTHFDSTVEAIMALLKIADNNQQQRILISGTLCEILSHPDFTLELLMKVDISTIDMTDYCRITIAKYLDRWQIKHTLYDLLDNASLGCREKALLAR